MVLLLSTFCVNTQAHDWWILARPATPQPDEQVRFEIGGGHAFPRSEELLAPRLIRQATLSGPDLSVPLDFVTDENRHITTRSLDRKGTYRAAFHVQRSGDDAPFIAACALMVVGEVDEQEAYAVNEGLEIVPLKPISEWQVGGEVPLEVRRDGNVVAALIRLERATGRPIRMRSAPGRPAVFTRWQVGPSLFVTEHQGQTATLTVWMKEEL